MKNMKDYYIKLVEQTISVPEKNKYLVYKDDRKEIYKISTSMKNLKELLKDYLVKNGKPSDLSYRELYDTYPFDGYLLTNKQKSDRVRSLWKSIKKKQQVVVPDNSYRQLEYTTSDTLGIMTVSDVVEDTQMGISNLPDMTLDIAALEKKQPKILIYDLETSPLKSYVWSLWKQNVNPTNGQLQSQKMILSWSAKWLFKEDVINDYMTPSEIVGENDSRITKSLWDLVDEADILIAHNGNGFDVKIMNTRFLLHGLPPPQHYQTIDTLLHARKKFRLESNKLDYIGQILGLGKKQDTGGFQLWVDCMDGKTEAMEKMVAYCDQDVRLLEAVYLKMRPWIMPHPNLNLIINDSENVRCPSCNSSSIKDNGTYTTYANIYPAHKCMTCHSTFRTRKAVKMDKTNLTIPTPN